MSGRSPRAAGAKTSVYAAYDPYDPPAAGLSTSAQNRVDSRAHGDHRRPASHCRSIRTPLPNNKRGPTTSSDYGNFQHYNDLPASQRGGRRPGSGPGPSHHRGHSGDGRYYDDFANIDPSAHHLTDDAEGDVVSFYGRSWETNFMDGAEVLAPTSPGHLDVSFQSSEPDEPEAKSPPRRLPPPPDVLHHPPAPKDVGDDSGGLKALRKQVARRKKLAPVAQPGRMKLHEIDDDGGGGGGGGSGLDVSGSFDDTDPDFASQTMGSLPFEPHSPAVPPRPHEPTTVPAGAPAAAASEPHHHSRKASQLRSALRTARSKLDDSQADESFEDSYDESYDGRASRRPSTAVSFGGTTVMGEFNANDTFVDEENRLRRRRGEEGDEDDEDDVDRRHHYHHEDDAEVAESKLGDNAEVDEHEDEPLTASFNVLPHPGYRRHRPDPVLDATIASADSSDVGRADTRSFEDSAEWEDRRSAGLRTPARSDWESPPRMTTVTSGVSNEDWVHPRLADKGHNRYSGVGPSGLRAVAAARAEREANTRTKKEVDDAKSERLMGMQEDTLSRPRTAAVSEYTRSFSQRPSTSASTRRPRTSGGETGVTAVGPDPSLRTRPRSSAGFTYAGSTFTGTARTESGLSTTQSVSLAPEDRPRSSGYWQSGHPVNPITGGPRIGSSRPPSSHGRPRTSAGSIASTGKLLYQSTYSFDRPSTRGTTRSIARTGRGSERPPPTASRGLGLPKLRPSTSHSRPRPSTSASSTMRTPPRRAPSSSTRGADPSFTSPGSMGRKLLAALGDGSEDGGSGADDEDDEDDVGEGESKARSPRKRTPRRSLPTDGRNLAPLKHSPSQPGSEEVMMAAGRRGHRDTGMTSDEARSVRK